MSLILAGCTSPGAMHPLSVTVKQMKSTFNGESGINQGVSACYAGVYNGMLLMAGGCNFPDKPAFQGGKKHFYRGIYITDISSDSVFNWEKVGELPSPAAYGVSVSTSEGIVCAGGCNAEGSLPSVWLLSINKDKHSVHIDTLPSLPCSLDNMSGAVISNTIYIVGGNKDGIPSNALYCLNLKKLTSGWKRLPDFPGYPRTQSVCAAQYKEKEPLLYLWGGFAGSGQEVSATLSVDGYCYHPALETWTSVAIPVGADNIPISLGGGSSAACGKNLILCMGGVNKDIFLAALKREEKMKKALEEKDFVTVKNLKLKAAEYMSMPPEKYCLNNRILAYNTCNDTWTEVAHSTSTARTGATLVQYDGHLFNINGELKPGIRTSEIIKITIK